MTREELEKEATGYALEWGNKFDGTYACCRDGYLTGYNKCKGEAREIITALLNVVVTEVTLNPVYLKLMQEAEQFIKEVK